MFKKMLYFPSKSKYDSCFTLASSQINQRILCFSCSNITIASTLKKVKQVLSQHQISLSEAEVLLSASFPNPQLWPKEQILLHSNSPLSEEVVEKLNGFVRRRCSGEPLAYIRGEQEFWSRPFHVTKDTLIPRADSETIIESLFDTVILDSKAKLKILDLGTGSGCLLITSLLHYRNATGVGVDISSEALKVARKNAIRHELAEDRCQFVQADFMQIDATKFDNFDVVLCNPPYIGVSERNEVGDDVHRFEPHLALYAKEDGLSCYHSLSSSLHQLLKPNAYVLLEIGYKQAPAVAEMYKMKYDLVKVVSDLQQLNRCLILRLKV